MTISRRDYQCAFFGGALLARTQFASPEEAEAELVNLFRINPNIVVVCDSDKTTPTMRIKDRVRRIRAEVHKIPGAYMWTTGPKEIENYLPGEIVARAVLTLYPPRSSRAQAVAARFRDPERFEAFFPSKTASSASYWELVAKKKSYDKTELAVAAVEHMTRDNMAPRFDLEAQITRTVDAIRSWKSR